ncbi:class I SAM-dependent methyltransferase [Fervidibacillus halotolerans]|uniref:Class I SAM-dependent methyltransferase n=1 Tax=Fervidibacillus halotolerans TaxID=2980027 RepID=A0A9E8M148_9BACI|nr:class I SAM-dependent methyltransferase [Fervidibacillus halotolerans]WAA12384.1 class I SAM-dependent methyltransferase [Fervidibacillus halotolerans]
MTEHYYSKNPKIDSKPLHWNYQLRGDIFHFKTDRGVFSKNEVDFGSKLLIHTFQEPSVSGPFLDVGCGYGPIGLALAKTHPTRTVHMIDINERAIRLAEENAKNNQVKNVEIYQSDGFEKVSEFSFAAIVTNPPIRAGKKIVFQILENSVNYLCPGGELWVVVQKKQGAPSIKTKLTEIFGQVTVVKKDKGYYIFRIQKNGNRTKDKY